MDDVKESNILLSIYNSSLMAKQIAEDHGTYWGDDEDPTTAGKQYTFYKTQLDIINNYYLNSGSSNSVDLADFSIDFKEYDEIDSILDNIKDNLKYWEDKLKGITNPGRAGVTSVLKSESSAPYSLNDRTF